MGNVNTQAQSQEQAQEQDEKQVDSIEKSKITYDEKPLSEKEITKWPDSLQNLINHKAKYEIARDGKSVTFYPSPHLEPNKNGTYGYQKEANGIQSLNDTLPLFANALECDSIEATFIDNSKDNQKVLSTNDRWSIKHSFISAAEIAWTDHLPLHIAPIHIWLMILQGIAVHVESKSQELRSKWVKHEGKKKLHLNRDEFIKGSKMNDWSGVISEFCEEIEKNSVEGTVPLVDADFSTSTIVDKISARVTIMDICKSYFHYSRGTLCGFPSIILDGNKSDWENLYYKTEKLLTIKVNQDWGKKWMESLLPILARFVSVYDGKIDCLFWNSMIKRGARHGSGGWSWYSGWFNVFFPEKQGCVPYNRDRDYVKQGLEKSGGGDDVGSYPNGLASAPVEWNYYGVKLDMKLIAGFVGVKQDLKTNALSPIIGWIIAEKTKEYKSNREILLSSIFGNIAEKQKKILK